MKKGFLKILAFVLTVTVIGAAFAGCSVSRDANTLEIRYYDGGFGSEWLNSAKQKFEAANPGITVKLEPDSDLQGSITTYLKSGKRLSDIYFNQKCDWQYFVTQGWIEPLDDVYEAEVERLDGTKVKVKDFIMDDRQDMPYMTARPGQGTPRPWSMPWSVLNCGMMYNEGVVLNTPRRSTGANWDKAPETMTELYEYIDDLNASDLKNSAGKKVAPFSVGFNGGMWWLSFPMKVWWAQHQGVVTPTARAAELGQGSYYDFWDFGAPEYDFEKNGNVWAQEGLAKGLDTLKSLLVKNEKWTNINDKGDEITNLAAEQAFVNGESAFIFVGNWIENEMRDFMPEGFQMKAMYVPSLDSAQIDPETGKPYKINNNAESDVILIPAQAPNKELAKKFLTFISSEEMLLDFSKNTGVARPFKYDPLDAEKDGFQYTDYVKSALQLFSRADFNIFDYPINKGGLTDEAERKEFVSYIYTYKQPDLFGGIPAGTCLTSLLQKTGAEIMDTVIKRTNTDYKTWVSDLGL